MSTNLWDENQTDSDSTDATVTATASTTTAEGEQSPLAAAIEASAYSRADIEMALNAAQVVLLAIWVVHTYTDD